MSVLVYIHISNVCMAAFETGRSQGKRMSEIKIMIKHKLKAHGDIF